MLKKEYIHTIIMLVISPTVLYFELLLPVY